MSIQPVHQGSFTFFHDLPIVVEATAAQLSSDAGLLPFRQLDEIPDSIPANASSRKLG